MYLRFSQENNKDFNNLLESTTTRIVGGLPLRPLAEKAKARQCLKRCGWNRMRSIRFENNQLESNRMVI